MQAVFNPDPLEVAFDPKGNMQKPWLFTKEHTFYDGSHYMQIPPGFRCDAESVPWWGRVLIGANSNVKRSAFFHDAAYAKQNMSRFSADAGMRVILEFDCIQPLEDALAKASTRAERTKLYWALVGTKLRVYAMYWAVRLFGGFAWRANQQ